MRERIVNLLFFFVFFLLIVFFSVTKYADYDLWWHLKLGEEILASGETDPPDSFSYTFNGKSQFGQEWLANVVIFLSHRAGGMLGVTVLKVFLLSITFLFLYLTAKRIVKDEGGGPFGWLLALVLIVFALRFRLFVRPYLFSFVFFSLFLLIISHYDGKRDRRILFALPFLELIWTNMSIGSIFGPFLLLFFFIGDSARRHERDYLPLVIFAVVLAASLCNPEFYGIYSLPLSVYHGVYQETVGEHQSLSLQLLWGYGLKYTLAYQILVLVSLVYFIFLRGWRNIFGVLLFGVFFLASVLMVRMIDFFSLVSILFVPPVAAAAVQIMSSRVFSRKAVTNGLAILLFLVSIPLAALGRSTYSPGVGIKEDTFPDEAVEFLNREAVGGRMFNSYSFGGYLIWKAPERKVFIDGRHRHLYDPEFYNAYFAALKDAGSWKSLEQKWGFDCAVLEYDMMSRRFPAHLNDNADWALVYWDNHSAVYLKRNERNEKTIDRHEYKLIKPNFYDFGYLQLYLHSGNAATALEYIDSDISLNPRNQEPRLAKAFLLYNMRPPRHDMALQELAAALILKPDLAMEHSALAFIMLQKGDTANAKEEIKKAVAIDPEDPGAAFLKEKLGM